MAAAATALKRRPNDGRGFVAETTDSSHHDTTNVGLQIESTNATELIDLNDDCLREILLRVSAMDLCSLSEMSKNQRLKAIANETFARKYGSFKLNTATFTVERLERLLAHFGTLITSLSTYDDIWGDDNSASKIRSVIRCCSGTLKGLKFTSITFGETQRALALIPLSKYLERPDLNSGDYGPIFQHTFPDLETLLFECYGRTKNHILGEFISRHKKLQSISLISIDDSSALLPIIAEHCTELKMLTISTNGAINPVQYETSVQRISTLKNLTKLTIRHDSNAVKFIRELRYSQSLRELTLEFVRYSSGIMTALSQLKRLEVLTIFYCNGGFTNFEPLAELCRLKELCIKSYEVVTLDPAYMVSRLTDLEKMDLELKHFTIDKEMQSRIANVRSRRRVGVKRRLQIVCNDITTQFW